MNMLSALGVATIGFEVLKDVLYANSAVNERHLPHGAENLQQFLTGSKEEFNKRRRRVK
jgi:hypothetical protein